MINNINVFLAYVFGPMESKPRVPFRSNACHTLDQSEIEDVGIYGFRANLDVKP